MSSSFGALQLVRLREEGGHMLAIQLVIQIPVSILEFFWSRLNTATNEPGAHGVSHDLGKQQSKMLRFLSGEMWGVAKIP